MLQIRIFDNNVIKLNVSDLLLALNFAHCIYSAQYQLIKMSIIKQIRFSW